MIKNTAVLCLDFRANLTDVSPDQWCEEVQERDGSVYGYVLCPDNGPYAYAWTPALGGRQVDTIAFDIAHGQDSQPGRIAATQMVCLLARQIAIETAGAK